MYNFFFVLSIKIMHENRHRKKCSGSALLLTLCIHTEVSISRIDMIYKTL